MDEIGGEVQFKVIVANIIDNLVAYDTQKGDKKGYQTAIRQASGWKELLNTVFTRTPVRDRIKTLSTDTLREIAKTMGDFAREYPPIVASISQRDERESPDYEEALGWDATVEKKPAAVLPDPPIIKVPDATGPVTENSKLTTVKIFEKGVALVKITERLNLKNNRLVIEGDGDVEIRYNKNWTNDQLEVERTSHVSGLPSSIISNTQDGAVINPGLETSLGHLIVTIGQGYGTEADLTSNRRQIQVKIEKNHGSVSINGLPNIKADVLLGQGNFVYEGSPDSFKSEIRLNLKGDAQLSNFAIAEVVLVNNLSCSNGNEINGHDTSLRGNAYLESIRKVEFARILGNLKSLNCASITIAGSVDGWVDASNCGLAISSVDGSFLKLMIVLVRLFTLSHATFESPVVDYLPPETVLKIVATF